ncbi:MAG: BlaI/MecI/CopY family transcriptional regulator [Patescibacteria group bacterium]
MLQQKFTPSLGSLEAEVMEILWKIKIASVRSVLNLLHKKREIAYTTVMTIMARLHAKGLLERREDQSGAYLYSPIENKEKFLARISEKVIKNLIKNCGEVAVAQFIDIMEAGNFKKSAEWKKRLKKIK